MQQSIMKKQPSIIAMLPRVQLKEIMRKLPIMHRLHRAMLKRLMIIPKRPLVNMLRKQAP